VNPTVVSRSVDVRATRGGVVNSLRLTSPLLISGSIRFQCSDSLVPPVIIPLETDVEVSDGGNVEVHIEYECETDWSRVRCGARVVQLAPERSDRLSREEVTLHGPNRPFA